MAMIAFQNQAMQAQMAEMMMAFQQQSARQFEMKYVMMSMLSNCLTSCIAFSITVTSPVSFACKLLAPAWCKSLCMQAVVAWWLSVGG